MENKLKIFQHIKAESKNKPALTQKGFTLFEILASVAIIGIMALVFYPNIIGTLETRKLEGSAREILTNLQRAKFQAVRTKLDHRVRFMEIGEAWFFVIEREDNPTEWNTMPGFVRKSISSQLFVNVDFPNQACEFSPLGLVSNFSSLHNSITLQSLKLATYGQYDQRIVSVLAGGSIQYTKTESE